MTRRSRFLLWPLGLAFGALGIGASLGCCALSAPPYRGPPSAHFDGERFHNEELEPEAGSRTAFLRWMLTRDRGPWRDYQDLPAGAPPPKRVGSGQLRVTWVNHATALIQMDGLNILTDPIWSERCSPFSWAGPRRVRPPGIRFEDLPPIDVVLISHNHYDHLDLPTLIRLARLHEPRIFTPLGTGAILEGRVPGGSTDLDWWQDRELGPGVRLTMVPAKHFSNRGICDRDENLWAGYVITGPAGVVYFAGDTGFGPHFQEIRDRFGPPRLALLPIGAFRPEWFMHPVHVSPDEAVRADQILGARTAMAIHFGTFQLGDDGQDEAPARAREAATAAGLGDRFWVPAFGEGRDVP